MKFGVREICDVVFKAKATVKIGNTEFKAGQPVLYIDSAKTSTIEGAATTVYATGGRGNSRLLTWEGEKTLTFTVEDALLSPIGFAILSGAGLLKNGDTNSKVHVHTTSIAYADTNGYINISDALGVETTAEGGTTTTTIDPDANIWIMTMEGGSITGAPVEGRYVAADASQQITAHIEAKDSKAVNTIKGKSVFVDYYIVKQGTDAGVYELQIDAENFAGYYYVEASTLFKRQDNGKDMPAEITFPNVKIQSNFTFNMASTGDPSTFTFTMDAMPGYTFFNPTRKVLCAIQIIDETVSSDSELETVFGYNSVNEDQFPYNPPATTTTT